jgi:hypothetical protein
MNRLKRQQVIPLLAMMGGVLSILSASHFMEKLAYAIGSYHEALAIISAYNTTSTQSILSLTSQATTATLAMYITFLMLPFSVILFTIGSMWLFSKSHMVLSAGALALSSFAVVLLTAIMEYMIGFSLSMFLVSYAGGVIPLAAGIYAFMDVRKPSGARAVGPISIDPQTPYTNMVLLSSRLMSRLGGELKILDMHFDATGLENLSRLLGGNLERYSRIAVLAKRDRLEGKFLKAYNDFKSELGNKGVAFELNVISDEDAMEQHERMLIGGSTAYKIPPLNIINKKSEHIVSISHKEAEERFDRLWQNSTKLENLK